MKFDITALRYMSKDELRTLVAVEIGMKNHSLVPVELISSLAGLKNGGAHKCVSALLRNKLVKHDRKKYDGYALNYMGYDFLAMQTLAKRDVIISVGSQLGVGKESDVFYAMGPEGTKICMKLHRLGRTSFRAIKNKRDYHKGRTASWLYLSRLAALKEFAFMKVLHDNGFPVPKPIDVNRHCVVMELVNAHLLNHIREMHRPDKVFGKLMSLMIDLANCGLVHCDFNEFNILINETEDITFIDFPQMVSVSHPNAAMYFDRDVECLRNFFFKRFGFMADEVPTLADASKAHRQLDVMVAASGFGFTAEHQKELDAMMASQTEEEGEGAEPSSEDGEEDGAAESEEEGEVNPDDAASGGAKANSAGGTDDESESSEEEETHYGVTLAEGEGPAGTAAHAPTRDYISANDDIQYPRSRGRAGKGRGGSRGGGAAGGGGGGGGGRPRQDCVKSARNRVKNRERSKNLAACKDY